MTKSNKKAQLTKMVELAVLIAIQLIMAFTPLGYLRIGILSITFMTVPVIIGAIVLGPAAGAVLGGFFGLTSFVQCFGTDAFGTTLMGISPIFTFILCFGARILMGLFTGLIFKGLAKIDKTKLISYGVTGIAGSLLNTIFFVAGFIIMFGNTEFFAELMQSQGANSLIAFAAAFVGVNGAIEAAVCFVVASAAAKALDVLLKSRKLDAA